MTTRNGISIPARNFLEDVAVMLKGVAAFEPAMVAFKPKDCMFRINRDVRFSANKNPYKNNFSAYFSPKGKKVEWPGYYVHVQPGAAFIGGGLWMPSSDVLKKNPERDRLFRCGAEEDFGEQGRF